MCGIVFALSDAQAAPDPAFERVLAGLVEANKARGPDSHVSHRTSTRAGHALHFFSSVLHLRGPATYAQPVVDGRCGDVLLWNGQVFEGLAADEAAGSDTGVLWDRLVRARQGADGETAVRDTLAGIEGPWASLYYDAAAEALFVSRDPLGRRSLLISHPTPDRPHLVISSISCAETRDWVWQEIQTDGIGRLDLGAGLLSSGATLSSIPRSGSGDATPFTSLIPVNSTLPPAAWSEPLADPRTLRLDDADLNRSADELIEALGASVRRRVENIPAPPAGQARLGVLFSGGIDCTVVALLASSYLPPNEPIDLLNVAFENPRALANAAAEALKSGRKKRAQVTAGPEPDGAADQPAESEEQRLARIYDVPDRLTGREAVAELRGLRPDRLWRFVEIDVPYEECQRETPHVLDLMIPSNTVMDLSLALALYFASRGSGCLREDGTTRPYASRAKVLLTGLGADEQLGGYARHRRAFEQRSWQGAIDEIQLDVDRLPTRNLGRDDRIISSHAVEARYPYLSLPFINHVSSLPIAAKMDFRLAEPRAEADPALGDKRLLRLGARRLGLAQAAGRKKRAMQFGARSAKMEVEERRPGGARKGWGAEALDRGQPS